MNTSNQYQYEYQRERQKIPSKRTPQHCHNEKKQKNIHELNYTMVHTTLVFSRNPINEGTSLATPKLPVDCNVAVSLPVDCNVAVSLAALSRHTIN